MKCNSLALAGLLTVTMNLVHAAQPADLFYFWLGDWDVSWKNADGSTGKARNRVAKILDGGAIEEVFEEDPADAAPLLHGRSLTGGDNLPVAAAGTDTIGSWATRGDFECACAACAW